MTLNSVVDEAIMSKRNRRLLVKFTIFAGVLFPAIWFHGIVIEQEHRRFEEESRPPAPKWSEFSPPGGGFVVFMPGTPDRTDGDQIDPLSGAKIPIIVYGSADGATAYSVGYFQYPPDLFNLYSPAELLALHHNSLVLHYGQLDSDAPVTLSGNPGNDIVYQHDGEISHSRFFVVGNRGYHLLTSTRNLSESQDRIDQFFNSFQWLP